MKKILLVLMLAAVFFTACKKDSHTTSNELIIGKWTFLPTTFDVYTNGSLSSTSTQDYTLQDYADFKINGTFESHVYGNVYNDQYKITGDTLVFNNLNKAKIKILTSTNLSYYFTENINATQYRISTFNLKK